jgi:nucleotidyltransferase substrate binding protein (TIGR01987 family)
MHSDFRWEQRFENYTNSLVEFRSAIAKESYTPLERAGLVQLFEISFELAWKTMKDILFYEGYDVKSPRAVIKQAFANDLITDGEKWLELLESRNKFSHMYGEEMAMSATTQIKKIYAPLLLDLQEALQGRTNTK